jgi:hypothetical protein
MRYEQAWIWIVPDTWLDSLLESELVWHIPESPLLSKVTFSLFFDNVQLFLTASDQ